MVNVLIDKKETKFDVARKSVAATTLYVREDGDDTNNGLTTDTALATIQEAIDRIPNFIDHDVIINIGAGTFTQFTLGGRDITMPAGIELKGTLQTASLATGNATGTSTSGNFVTLTDTTQSWTPGDLVGRIVNHDTYANDVIISNTSTSLTVAAPSWYTMSGKAYTIKDHATVITPESGTSVSINGCSGGNVVRIQDVRILSGAGKGGIEVYYCDTSVMLDRLRVENVEGLAVNLTHSHIVGLNNCYIKNPTDAGLFALHCNNVWASATFISCGVATTKSAVVFYNIPDGWLTGTYQGSTYHGVELNNSVVIAGPLTVQNNTKSGIHMESSTLWRGFADATDSGVVTGTGNGRFGINMRSRCLVKLAGVPAVTGTLGNYSFNDSFARTWATDFASNGDVMINDDTMSRVERVD